jgi:arylsulfatase A-like enzyme
MISHYLKQNNCECGYIGKWHIGEKMGPNEYGFEGTSFAGYGLPSNYVKDYDDFLKENDHPGLNEVKVKNITASIDMPEVKFPLAKFKLPEEVRGTELYSGVIDLPTKLTPAGFVAQRTMEMLEKHRDSSFFITASFWGPHHPAFPSEEFSGTHKPEDIEEWKNFRDTLSDKPPIQKRYVECLHKRLKKESWPLWSKVIAAHFDFMTMIDAQAGRILDKLDELGISEETMVIFTADHGDSLGCHGGLWDKGPYAYDEVCKVPLIVKTPSCAPNQSNALVSNMDIYSTVLDYQGTEIPDESDSVSFLPVVKGEKEKTRDAVFTHFHGFDVRGTFLQRVIRKENFKYAYNPSSIDEFYNLEEDPYEMNNLINSANESAKLKEMKEDLLNEMKRSNDPFTHFADEFMGIRK